MNTRETGFTLIEVVVAFTILAIATVLAVNVVTQSSIRTQHVSEHMGLLETLESAIAQLHVSLLSHQADREYRGGGNDSFQWHAAVLGLEREPADGRPALLNLYRVKIAVFHDSGRPRMEMLTLIPDR